MIALSSGESLMPVTSSYRSDISRTRGGAEGAADGISAAVPIADAIGWGADAEARCAVRSASLILCCTRLSGSNCPPDRHDAIPMPNASSQTPMKM
jgi:hypothetical protein